MKTSITLTPTPDNKGYTYTAETDEPNDSHPLLDQMRRDLLNVYLGVNKPTSVELPALVTTVAEKQLQDGRDAIQLGLAINLVTSLLLDDPRVEKFLHAFGMNSIPKNPNKVLSGKELNALVTIEDTETGPVLMIQDFP